MSKSIGYQQPGMLKLFSGCSRKLRCDFAIVSLYRFLKGLEQYRRCRVY